MIDQIRYIWQLLVIASVIMIAGILAIPASGIDIPLTAFVITLITFTFINLITYLIMIRGLVKKEREGMVILLAGLGVKFLLYLFYILGYWLVTKNISKPFILIYFALYLVFTFFLAGHLLKFLRNK